MSTVLVTGGAGFIGSHVAERLLARGHHVTVLDDLSGGFEENVPSGATRDAVPHARALRDMASWVRRHGARRSSPFPAIEIARGLPEAWTT